MHAKYVSFIASREAIQELYGGKAEDGIQFSEPVAMESPADILDAPIGLGEVKVVLELLTVAINTTAAGAILIERIFDLIKKYQGLQVRIQDPKSGRELGRVSVKTSREEVARVLAS